MRAIFQFIVGLFSLGIAKLFGRLEVQGIENIKFLTGPIIIIANHKSNFDPMMVGIAVLNNINLLPIRFATKDQLLYIPIFNIFIWLLGAFRLHRGKGLIKSLDHPLKILFSDGTIMIFPEGKIIPNENILGEGKTGAALLALTSAAPILPLALKIEPRLTWWKFITKRPPITIKIGKPFNLSKKPRPIEEISKEETLKATQAIMSKLSKLYFGYRKTIKDDVKSVKKS